ncbi:MAG: lysylphosphatidylglycerol synthase transmembrane domain-containing protein [Actinomycetota bacterium]|nr:lysylphosphatidylglycerol synthase transmembrane domain-containing protein [Actinomycetota bacterium]
MPKAPEAAPPLTPREGGRPRVGQQLRRWRPSSRLGRALAALGAVALVVALVLRAPSAAHDFARAFANLHVDRLYWLAPALVAEYLSFVAFAAIQRLLFSAGGVHPPLRLLLRLSVASSGLRALLPVGALPSSGWLFGEFRQLGIDSPLALFVVLASGFVSTVCLLELVILGAAIAGATSPVLLAVCFVVLSAGSAGFVAAVHRLGAIERHAAGRGAIARALRRLVRLASGVARLQPGWRTGALSFGAAAANWLADLVCLIAAFALLGVAIPWRDLLFAYAGSQLAGSVVPLPGGLGAVEGGLIGVLDLAGVPIGAGLAVAVLYRAITYWGVAAFGGIELFFLARHPLTAASLDPPRS